MLGRGLTIGGWCAGSSPRVGSGWCAGSSAVDLPESRAAGALVHRVNPPLIAAAEADCSSSRSSSLSSRSPATLGGSADIPRCPAEQRGRGADISDTLRESVVRWAGSPRVAAPRPGSRRVVGPNSPRVAGLGPERGDQPTPPGLVPSRLSGSAGSGPRWRGSASRCPPGRARRSPPRCSSWGQVPRE